MAKTLKRAASQPNLAHANLEGRIKRGRKRVGDSLLQALARMVGQAFPIVKESEGADAAARLQSALQALEETVEEVSRAIQAASNPSMHDVLLEGLHRAMWHTASLVSMADRKIVRKALQSSRTKAPSKAKRHHDNERQRLLDEVVESYANKKNISLDVGEKFFAKHGAAIIATLPPSALERWPGWPSKSTFIRSVQRVKKKAAKSSVTSSV